MQQLNFPSPSLVYTSTYPISDTSRKYGLHNNTCTPSTHDTKPQTWPVIVELNSFNVSQVLSVPGLKRKKALEIVEMVSFELSE